MLPLPTVEILKKLNSAELKRFGDFIKSPYFNSISALEIIKLTATQTPVWVAILSSQTGVWDGEKINF
ncbi:MAG: hypothetical protein K1X86_02575 [Ignavibacteria bacterium]|nr:hypothetical protein [Ignavibacteria bacterium]